MNTFEIDYSEKRLVSTDKNTMEKYTCDNTQCNAYRQTVCRAETHGHLCFAACKNQRCEKYKIRYLLSDNHQCTVLNPEVEDSVEPEVEDSSEVKEEKVSPKINVILDLHGTLISETYPEMRKRPYLDDLLRYLFATCQHVSVWTASDILFVRPFLNYCKKQGYNFHFIYHADQTVRAIRTAFWGGIERVPVKPLKKVWKRFKDYTKDNTLIVDDTSTTYERNYGNAVPIREWDGYSQFDTHLLGLIKQIAIDQAHFAEHGTVRGLERRNWWLMAKEAPVEKDDLDD